MNIDKLVTSQRKDSYLKQVIGKRGLLNVYYLFNESYNADVRKLSAQLLCESTFNNEVNQQFFCDLFNFNPMNGRVCLNRSIPENFKKKFAGSTNMLGQLQAVMTPSLA